MAKDTKETQEARMNQHKLEGKEDNLRKNNKRNKTR